MKKHFVLLLLSLCLSHCIPAEARYCHHSSYLVHKDYYQEEFKFPNCDKHSILKETTVYYYSNGTRNYYTTNTIFNSDGSILESGCSNVKHYIHDKKHYFTYYKNKKYQILDENGELLTVKKYKKMNEVAPNKLLVKLDKKFGIIDLNEKIIVPIKYKKFEQIGQNIFLTKLNGYYGICDNSNQILVKNENDKISALYDTFVIKKYDKYGLADKNGKIILPTDNDSIKKLGEYILVKKERKYGVLDSFGKIIADIKYNKIRLNRNTLEGYIDKNWQALQ